MYLKINVAVDQILLELLVEVVEHRSKETIVSVRPIPVAEHGEIVDEAPRHSRRPKIELGSRDLRRVLRRNSGHGHVELKLVGDIVVMQGSWAGSWRSRRRHHLVPAGIDGEVPQSCMRSQCACSQRDTDDQSLLEIQNANLLADHLIRTTP